MDGLYGKTLWTNGWYGGKHPIFLVQHPYRSIIRLPTLHGDLHLRNLEIDSNDPNCHGMCEVQDGTPHTQKKWWTRPAWQSLDLWNLNVENSAGLEGNVEKKTTLGVWNFGNILAISHFSAFGSLKNWQTCPVFCWRNCQKLFFFILIRYWILTLQWLQFWPEVFFPASDDGSARGVSDGPTQNYWEVRIPEPGFQWIFQVRTNRVGSVLYNRPIGRKNTTYYIALIVLAF